MANTYTLIASYSATGSVSSINFTSIPSTYTDLVVKVSCRASDAGSVGMRIAFNGSSSSFTNKYIQGAGSGTPSSGSSAQLVGVGIPTTYTASTFTNDEIYIPNYTSSNYKSFASDAVQENNATLAYSELTAGLWSNTAAINQITLTLDSSANFLQYSTAYIYGISNS